MSDEVAQAPEAGQGLAVLLWASVRRSLRFALAVAAGIAAALLPLQRVSGEDQAQELGAVYARLSALDLYSPLVGDPTSDPTGLDTEAEVARRLALWPRARLEVGVQAAQGALDAAQVIVICDDHRIEWCRDFAAKMVQCYSTRQAEKSQHLTVALESLNADMSWGVRIPSGEADQWLDRMSRNSPWPKSAYGHLLQQVERGQASVLPLGFPSLCEVDPAPQPAHMSRTGHLSRPSAESLRKYVDASRVRIVSAVAAWQKQQAAEKGKLIVLYGAAHVLGRHGFLQDLKKLGLDTVCVAPFTVRWERSIWARFGASAGDTWFEPMEGILRPPGVTEHMIRHMPWPSSAPSGPGDPMQLGRIGRALEAGAADFLLARMHLNSEAGGEESLAAFLKHRRASFAYEPNPSIRRRLMDAAEDDFVCNPIDAANLLLMGCQDKSQLVRLTAGLCASGVDTRTEPLHRELLGMLAEARTGPHEEDELLFALALAGSVDPSEAVLGALVRAAQGARRRLPRLWAIRAIALYGFKAEASVAMLRGLQESSEADEEIESAILTTIRFILADARRVRRGS